MRGVGNDMEYNPLTTGLSITQNDVSRYSKRLHENKAWYSGEVRDLSNYYTLVTNQEKGSDGTRPSGKPSSTGTAADKILERTWFWATAFINNTAGEDNHVRYTTGVAPKIPSTPISSWALSMGITPWVVASIYLSTNFGSSTIA